MEMCLCETVWLIWQLIGWPSWQLPKSLIDFGILEFLNVLVMLFGWSKLPHLVIDVNENPNFIKKKKKKGI
jgi:hypothetical protein